MLLAIIVLVCPEARVKFKNIDFQTEADFACYCNKLIDTRLVKCLVLSVRLVNTQRYTSAPIYVSVSCQCAFNCELYRTRK
jgi:hypothetical protein